MSGYLEEHFTMRIRLGDEAMRTEADVAEALRRIADRLEAERSPGTFQTILDVNGNDVGRWKLGLVDVAGRAANYARES